MKYLIRFDWAIKRLLRNKADYGILEGFLSELLGEDIKIESILESETNKEKKTDKKSVYDLLVRNAKGELVIIEIQNNREHDYLQRMLYGVSKLLVENMETGMLYSEVKKIISVHIVFFDLGQGDDYVYRGYTLFEGIHTKNRLELSPPQQDMFKTEKIDKIYPEYYIIKVNQFDEIAKNSLDEWIYFLKTEDIKDDFKAKGLKEAKEKLAIMKLSEADRIEYDIYVEQIRVEMGVTILNFKEGEIQGIKIGEANKEEYANEKVRQNKLDMAINCLKEDMPITIISKLTGLTESEIEALRNA